MLRKVVALLSAAMLAGCAPTASPPKASDAAVTPAPAAAIQGVGVQTFDHSAFDKLLSTYVKDGRFDYAGLKGSPSDEANLQRYLDSMGSADASKLSKPEQFAFWVNAYNAFNIKTVIDNHPITSPKDVDGFFDRIQYKVSGVNMTVNDMEYVQMIPAQKDARAHFVVVCADMGSVPLESRAYTAANLDNLLTVKTRQFVADPKNFGIDMTGSVVYVSKLFDWYADDFIEDPQFSGNRAVEYLAPYVAPDQAAFLRDGAYEVVFTDWDWSLNGDA